MFHILYLGPDKVMIPKCSTSPSPVIFFKLIFGDKFQFPGKFTHLEKVQAES